MVVIVKKKRTSRRPGLLQPTDSVSSMRSTTERSLSSSSLKKNGSDWGGAPFKAPAVSFAQDYGCPDTVHPPPEPLGDEEIKESFYNVS